MVRKEGVEFYFIRFDPTNHCNLLKFYSMDRTGEITYKKKYERICNKHFNKVMTQEHIKEIEEAFYKLKKELQNKLEYIYNLVPEKKNKWKSELNFNKIFTG